MSNNNEENSNTTLIIGLGIVTVFIAYLIHSSRNTPVLSYIEQPKQHQMIQPISTIQQPTSITQQYPINNQIDNIELKQVQSQIQQMIDTLKIQNNQIKFVQDEIEKLNGENFTEKIQYQNEINNNKINNNKISNSNDIIPTNLSKEDEERYIHNKFYII